MPLILVRPQPAPAAYRADMAGRESSAVLSTLDGQWIAVSALVCRAVDEPLLEQKQALYAEALALASECIGPESLSGPSTWHPADGGREWTTQLHLLVDSMEEAGALNLAAAVLDALLLDTELPQITHGRILAHRARITRKRGELEAATFLYQEVERIAKQAPSVELVVRSLTGKAAIAQMRGNYPSMRRLSARATKLAEREGMTDLAAVARQGLLVAAIARGRFSEAVILGWQNYEAASGHPAAESVALANFARLLLEVGRPAEAHAAYQRLFLIAPNARVFLPAVAGLVRAAVATNRRESISWAVREMKERTDEGGFGCELSLALCECAIALKAIGDIDGWEAMRERALRIAGAHGFHEVPARLESAETRESAVAVAAPLSRAAERVAQRVAGLDQGHLPSQTWETLTHRGEVSPALSTRPATVDDDVS